MNTLKAEKRDLAIKAKKLRREGFVTGNIFGKEIEGSIPVMIKENVLDKALKTSHKGSQINLDVDGTKYDVLIKEIQMDTSRGKVEEIDFQALVSNEMVNAVAEVVIENKDLTKSGIAELITSEIKYKALPAALVDTIKIDAKNMEIGDVIRVRDLDLAKDTDVKILTKEDDIVMSVSAPHNEALPTQEEAEANAAAAQPAAQQ
ncbi:MAG: 50S ribosomal protein L25 [Lachnospiraceae bacterium]|nr:50S ribosomal protein L25 [Lachnospiraceae bacterium]